MNGAKKIFPKEKEEQEKTKRKEKWGVEKKKEGAASQPRLLCLFGSIVIFGKLG